MLNVTVNRDVASSFGILPSTIDNTLDDAFGQRIASTIYSTLNQYRVILEVAPQYQMSPDTLSRIYVNSSSGQQVPLSTLVNSKITTMPLVINHQGLFPSVTISFNLKPGVALGDAVNAIRQFEQQSGKPLSLTTAFQGNASAFMSSLSGEPILIAAALIVIYIILGVLYESTIHPITILSTLPSAGIGALLLLMAVHMDLSVIAMLGIILLIGIVKKNGIMLVDFAIHAERNNGLTPEKSIYQACILRFRPILMTTMAALLGGVPSDARHRRRCGDPPTARLHDRRRAAALSAADAVHHAGRLPLPRPPAEPALRQQETRAPRAATDARRSG